MPWKQQPVGTLGYGGGVSGKLMDEFVLEGCVRHLRRKTKVLPRRMESSLTKAGSLGGNAQPGTK